MIFKVLSFENKLLFIKINSLSRFYHFLYIFNREIRKVMQLQKLLSAKLMRIRSNSKISISSPFKL